MVVWCFSFSLRYRVITLSRVSSCQRAIDHRYTTLSIALAMMIVMGGMMTSGRVVFQFFPSVSGNNVVARVVMPEGYPLAGTQAVVEKIQASAVETRRIVDGNRSDGSSAFKNELSSIGVTITQGALVMIGATGSHVAEMRASRRRSSRRRRRARRT